METPKGKQVSENYMQDPRATRGTSATTGNLPLFDRQRVLRENKGKQKSILDNPTFPR